MAVSRSDINRALDDLVEQEEGMRFQALAVILAKKKWPELIACERRNDRGLDAYAARSLVLDRKGKGLASSITPTLDKIRDDATKAKANFSDVDVLIFATTGKVTNQTIQTWAAAIKKEFGYELVVMPREEIISSLIDPDNVALCSMIGIAVPPPAPAEADILSKARAAAGEEQTKWRSRLRGAGRPVIDLTAVAIDRDNNTTDVLINGAQIRAFLTESRRVVLEGRGGGGKTTMLVELAKSGPDGKELSFLVDLPSWVRSRRKILDYIASAPSYQARGLTAADLARLSGIVHVNFLLNGWNEVAEAISQEAIDALAELEREFPATGILIATRTHFVGPPLPGAVRARLLDLTRRQRAAYIRASIQDRPGELLQQIGGSRSLDSLTRLPLILAEVTTLFASGRPIPTTRVGVLGAVISLAEESPEHRSHLQTAPLFNRASAILRDLAAGMMDRGEIEIAEDDAIAVIAFASDGRGAGIPKQDIPALLRALCAHHVLELTGNNPAAYRFQHQQYQEFYAAAAAAARLAGLPAGSVDIASDFSLRCVNRPLWEEPLRMVAEDIASRTETGDKQAVDLGAILVGTAIKIDPVFGAHLARLAGKDVWARVGDQVRAILREWYAVSDRHHRQCALAAMFATGSGDFADIIGPLLTDKDQQTRLRAYNTAAEFYPTSLGDDWKTVVAGWDEAERADFVGEAAHRNRMIDIGEVFAVHDPSAAVRLRAVQALSWAGATDTLARVLGALDVEALKPLVPVLLSETVPETERPRIVAANRSLLSNEATPLGRIRIFLRGAELGDESVSADLKRELEDPALKVDQNSEHTIHQAVLAVGKRERQWASDWAISRMTAGEVSGRSWASLVSQQPERKLEELVDKLAAGELPHREFTGIQSVLAASATPAIAARLAAIIATEKSGGIKPPVNTRQVRWTFNALPAETAIAGLMDFTGNAYDQTKFETLASLVGTLSAEDTELHSSLADPLRQRARSYIKLGIAELLAQTPFNAELGARAAIALGRVGDKDDVPELLALIEADFKRLQTDGGRMGYANWYVRAVEFLDPPDLTSILIGLLREHYEGEAASVLLRLAQPREKSFSWSSSHVDFELVEEARAGKQPARFNAALASAAAEGLRKHLTALQSELPSATYPDAVTLRLKRLACALAKLDAKGSASLVISILKLPAKWDHWARVEGVKELVHGGVTLSFEDMSSVLDPAIEYLAAHGHQDQDLSLLINCLELLLMSDDPTKATARAERLMSGYSYRPYQFRELVTAAGHTRSPAALDFLLRAAKSASGLQNIEDVWIEALAKLDLPPAREALLSFVDPAIAPLGIAFKFDYRRAETYAATIAEWARADEPLRRRLYDLSKETLSKEQQSLLVAIYGQIGTDEALLNGLNLIKTIGLPFYEEDGFGRLFLERRDAGGGSFNLIPRDAATLRAKLLDIVLNDTSRRDTAFAILGQIELMRLEYGRPPGEPRHPEIATREAWPPLKLLRPPDADSRN